MTITFPIALSATLISRLATCDFDLDYSQEVAPTRGGVNIARDLAPPLWLASFQSGFLTPVNYKLVDMWLKSLGGSVNPFLAYDLARSFPLNYPNGFGGMNRAGGGAFDGTAPLNAVASDNVTVTLTTLPAAFVMSIGDYLAFQYNTTSQALHQVVAGGTGDGSGNLSVEVRPQIQGGWSGSTVTLAQPCGKFLIQPKSVKKTLQPAGYGRIAFQGIQTLG